MNLSAYPVVADSLNEEFKFYSVGPKGLIKKYIRFHQIARNIYNLSFGDWRELKGFTKADGKYLKKGRIILHLHSPINN